MLQNQNESQMQKTQQIQNLSESPQENSQQNHQLKEELYATHDHDEQLNQGDPQRCAGLQNLNDNHDQSPQQPSNLEQYSQSHCQNEQQNDRQDQCQNPIDQSDGSEMNDMAAQLTAAWRAPAPEKEAVVEYEKQTKNPPQNQSRPLQNAINPNEQKPQDFSDILRQSREENSPEEFVYDEHTEEINHDIIAPADYSPTQSEALKQGAMPDLSSPLEEDVARARKKLPKKKSRALTKKREQKSYTAEQRILLLDTWKRSGLPAKDFSAVVGMNQHTLYVWNSKFEKQGPAGLFDKPKGSKKGSRLPEITKRMILMIKDSNPEAGCEMISDMLARSPGVPASATAVSKVLKEAGYEYAEVPTKRHPDKKRRFERAKPNMMWQTDIFTFTLKRLNTRVHLVVYMDDHSRFIVSYGLRSVASTDMVIEALQAGLVAFGTPDELLTDNGPQYKTWRGKSKFTKYCERRGIQQILSSPRHPQTLGKVERFWRTIWEGFLATAVFLDLEDARRRIGLFIDHYNFKRPHSAHGGGLVPSDKFFGVAPDVMESMKKRMHDNALEIAKKGFPKQPFYLTGQASGMPFSLHEEDGRVYMLREGGEREEVELVTPFDLERDAMDAENKGFNSNMRNLVDGLESED